MYTSGTTGDPKGVLISNESILSIIAGVNHHMEDMNEEFTEKDVYLSYLPLAHIFDRVIEELFISKGASIGFWHKDVKQLIDDIKELKPTAFCAVPRTISGLTETCAGSFVSRPDDLTMVGTVGPPLPVVDVAYNLSLKWGMMPWKHPARGDMHSG
nr:long chain acyl-CoA synthetase 4-like [Ipomoea batatas]